MHHSIRSIPKDLCAGKVFYTFCLALFSLFRAQGTPDDGKVNISVFSKSEYAAGTQNWDLERDHYGRLYVANNEGLLIYNGLKWQLYPVPNKTILRSIAFGADGRLYAGAQDELGYYAPDINGRLVYTSLKELIPKAVNSFADIWNIEVLDNEVFFMASDIIFRLAKNKITYYKPRSTWLSLKKHHNQLIAQDGNGGILTFTNGRWETLTGQNSLPPGFLISDIKPYGQDTSLVSTNGNGLFLLTSNSIHPFVIKNTNSEKYFTSLDVIDRTCFLAGSYNTGLYKIDRNGNVLDRISAKSGLISNTIRCIHTGFDGSTWIGLDNSIAFIEWNNPIRHINPPSFNNGSGHAAAMLNGELYFALTTGLQWVPLAKNSDLSKADIEPQTILSGLTWNLSPRGNRILAGRDDGLWTISNHQATNVSRSSGYWTFQPIPGTLPTQLACGNYKGIELYEDENGQLRDKGAIKEFVESSRYLETDGPYIWVSHPYHGLFRIGWKDQSIKKFTTMDGLPADLENHVFKIKGKIVFATTKGIYEPDKTGNKIIPSTYYQSLLGKRSIRYLKEDRTGNIWFVHEKMLGIVDVSEPKPLVRFIPELSNRILSGFEHIFPYDDKNVLVGSEIGFYNINYDQYRQNKLSFATYITSVRIIGNNDSVIYGGFDKETPGKHARLSIPYKYNSIQFAFASSFLKYKNGTEFSYYLEGYDKNWSNWSRQNEKDYTNLPEGKYTFHVRSRFGPSGEFKSYTYSFKIRPPWYRTVWAYIVYILGFAAGILFILYLQKKKLQKKAQSRMLAEKQKFEDEQNQIKYRYQLQLEKKEKAIIQLKNENLEAELQHKNTELASAAMNLLQKKAFLRKIGEELNKVYLQMKDQMDTSEIKKILRHLNSEEKLDEEWKQFSIHFNNVHSNFLITLKEVFPDLNAHEMKLCAYLRMNLSSKEIAQLLSISVRGVEISRYRLRKKLKLQPNEDLFEFLFNMKPVANGKSDQVKDTP